ncbi:GLTP domain-containing protein [Ascoidea rubescens DSM 1968]|uniref:Glycolipid transfer protein n=1 Tax=Ascoidea rubescens DSM 1968 TaxID=1344418 RepID=A0A1D2VLJ1_9ASCO|nr:glycolipid transfer protein [Ascoidea rubescens DSM 1968]ODV62462.1 glycolipid transfer protein [Ascoidea rubescens DSM 1968]
MSTFFDGKKSFTEVPVNSNKIDTSEFLLATEDLIKLFDLLGSTAFNVVQSDMTGNVKKIRDFLLKNPSSATTLQDIVLAEKAGKDKTATQGLLWLSRGLQFTAQAMRETVDNPSKEMTETFTSAYNKTLVKYHNMFVRPVFKLAMKACPYRSDFFKKLGEDQAKVMAQLLAWLAALENIVQIIFDFYKSGNYGKGL